MFPAVPLPGSIRSLNRNLRDVWFRKMREISPGVLSRGGGGGGGGRRLGSNFAWMCVSKCEGHGSSFGFKGVK